MYDTDNEISHLPKWVATSMILRAAVGRGLITEEDINEFAEREIEEIVAEWKSQFRIRDDVLFMRLLGIPISAQALSAIDAREIFITSSCT